MLGQQKHCWSIFSKVSSPCGGALKAPVPRGEAPLGSGRKEGGSPSGSDVSPRCLVTSAPTAAGAAAPSAAQQVQGPPTPQAQHPLTLVQLRQGEEILVVSF